MCSGMFAPGWNAFLSRKPCGARRSWACHVRSPIALIPPGRLTCDAPFHTQKARVYPTRINTPTRRQHGDFINIQKCQIRLAEAWRFDGVQVTEALKVQFFFGGSPNALRPKRLAGPGVGADNAAAVSLHPSVVMQDAAAAEELNVAQPAAQFQQESETDVHVLAWIRQTRAHYQNPAFDRWGYEELFFTRQALDPGTGFGMMQTER